MLKIIPSSNSTIPKKFVPTQLNVGDFLQVKVVSYNAFGFLTHVLSQNLPDYWKKKDITIHIDVLKNHFPRVTSYSDLIHTGDTLEVVVTSVPTEQRRQICVELTSNMVLQIKRKMPQGDCKKNLLTTNSL